MKTFSINQLEEFTGIRKHTLRIWEQRYSFVQPVRTRGKLRSYSLAELKILLDIILLYQSGEKISKLVGIDASVRKQKVGRLNSNAAIEIKTIYQLIISMYASDIEQFERLLDDHVVQFGIHRTIEHILIPFLERVKLFSYADTSIEAHFVVSAIRKKIISGIEQLSTIRNSDKSVLLFLTQDEHYDLILLYMAYLLKKSGIQVWYLGTNINIENLKAVLSTKQPSSFLTFLSPRQKVDLGRYYDCLNEEVQVPELLVAISNGGSSSIKKIRSEKYFHYSMLLENIGLRHQ